MEFIPGQQINYTHISNFGMSYSYNFLFSLSYLPLYGW